MMAVERVLIGGGLYALVDADVVEGVSRFNWSQRRGLSGIVYAERHIILPDGRRSSSRMHREIMGATDRGVWVDHRNHNGLDNRRSNLRLATATQNNANQRLIRGGRSRFKGVSLDLERGTWRAKISVNGRQVSLGRYALEVDAAHAYNTAAVETFGEFAYLNDVPGRPVKQYEQARMGGSTRRVA